MRSSRNTLYDSVFEALPCDIVVHDGEQVVLANAAACHTFGAMSPRSLVGLPLSALMRPTDDSPAEARRLLRAGQRSPFLSPMSLSVTELGGDTMVIEAMVRGFAVGGCDYAIVVRCRHYAGLETPAVERPEFPEDTPLARAALDTMLQPVTVYDEDDHFLFSNAASQELFVGAPEPPLAGHPVSSVIHPVTRDAARERRRLVLEAGQSFPHIEAKLRRLDGKALHVVGSLGSARLPGGNRVGYWMAHAVGDGKLADAAGSA